MSTHMDMTVSPPTVDTPGIQRHPLDELDVIVMRLLDYCKKNNWAGFDPYDALNSRLLTGTPLLKSRICRIAFTQIIKRLPINIRPLLLISKVENPKAIALFLMAFIKLSRLGRLGDQGLVQQMIDKLVDLRSPHSSYWCWGYSFPWQTRTILVPSGEPNLVSTCFVSNALLDAFELKGNRDCLNMAVSAAEYIVNELYWTDHGGVASFSYPLPSQRSQVHNANFVAAALLLRVYKHTGEKILLEHALNVARFSATKQKRDGSWDYGEVSTQGWVDNFHTGYNLCALSSMCENAESSEFMPHIQRGLAFYRRYFFREDGAPRYFHNHTYPIDIHSVAQSIITLITLKDLGIDNLALAKSIFTWAISHMWDKDGYFYYRVLPIGTNKISYMRWSQAWMLLALTTFLEHLDSPVFNSPQQVNS